MKFLNKKEEEFEIDLDDPFNNRQIVKKYYYQNILDLNQIVNNDKFLEKLTEIINYEESFDDPKTIVLSEVGINLEASKKGKIIKIY